MEVFWPAARSRAATRGVLFLAATVLSGVATFVVYASLQFGPSVAGSRVVDYGIAVAALPLPILTWVGALRAARWLLLAAWPKPVGIRAREAALSLELGPFGIRRFDVARLEVKYPFELSGDFEEGSFEAFLPEEQQVAQFVPRMSHPEAAQSLHQTILRFGAGNEADIAAGLRPMIERWRGQGLSPGATNADDA
jgi:hypothetical protein